MSMQKWLSARSSVLKKALYVVCMLLGLGWAKINEGTSASPQSLNAEQLLPFAPPVSTESWFFLSIAGMKCADGSETGIGINLASQSSGKLLVYLEGGGGCWNVGTCRDRFHIQNANLHGFNATTLEQVMISGAPQYNPPIPKNHGSHGIWDRNSTENPFSEYNYIYIPYCTADFHMGNRPDSQIDGLSHVGYANMTKALGYLAGAFSPTTTTDIVLTGGSAGGIGALWNFPQAQAIFGMIPVTLIAESGPPLPAPYLSPALEEAWRSAWGLDDTKEADAPSTHLFPYLRWIAQNHPSNRLGFVEMTGDATVALFLGIPLIGKNSLSNGLFELRQQLHQTTHNVSFFLIPSISHDYLHQDPSSWPTPSNPFGHSGLSLNEWIRFMMK